MRRQTTQTESASSWTLAFQPQDPEPQDIHAHCLHLPHLLCLCHSSINGLMQLLLMFHLSLLSRVLILFYNSTVGLFVIIKAKFSHTRHCHMQPTPLGDTCATSTLDSGCLPCSRPSPRHGAHSPEHREDPVRTAQPSIPVSHQYFILDFQNIISGCFTHAEMAKEMIDNNIF